MGRNDLCFCMSGKKNKNCHVDIHEESEAAAKIKIYSQLDTDFINHRSTSNGLSLCIPGCIDCCYDYFTVQSIEFDLILNELAKWPEGKLNNFIERVHKYWSILENQYPEATELLLKATADDIEEINSSIDKTSFPCIFLHETTHLCEIYDFRPFKCRIFGTTYCCPQPDNAQGIACMKYEGVLNDDNFDSILFDVTDLLDENTTLSIHHDKKQNVTVLNPEYPLIYYFYQHFIVKKLGVSIVDFDEKFKRPRSNYYSKSKGSY